MNGRIRVSPVLVIKDGEKLGTMEISQALHLAKSAGLDLVEVSPHSRPPVCKILDYGKMKYDEKKKDKEKKAKQAKVVTKEMKFRPKTDNHDLQFKTNHVKRFLEEGNRCLLVVQFRGRERVHPRVGEELLYSVADSLAELAEVAKRPMLEGSRMTMLLAPKISS